MTRFARAKGSKSSNERLPQAPTPWKAMKEDLQKSQEEAKNNKCREKINQERQKNYDDFIKEANDKIEKKWADIPQNSLIGVKMAKNIVSDKKIDRRLKFSAKTIENVSSSETDDKSSIITNKNNSSKIAKIHDDEAPEEVTTKKEPTKFKVEKKKKKKFSLKIASFKSNTDSETKIGSNVRTVYKKKEPVANQDSFVKAQKRKQPKQNHDNKEHKRRKPITEAQNSIKVNGQAEAIVYYQRFPILKSDQERLVALKLSLISKGIPKSEVNRTIKLERRKAEKRLARTKKIVCFNCRESGHMLSECPQLEDKSQSLVESATTGICFKCGSIEHSHRDCKVNHDYKYAKCFICREQGHIASQCPDNPRGLYPKGGACKLCGNVTHLKKDCPKYQAEQEENTLFLKTISSGNVEYIDDVISNKKNVKHIGNKIVKF